MGFMFPWTTPHTITIEYQLKWREMQFETFESFSLFCLTETQCISFPLYLLILRKSAAVPAPIFVMHCRAGAWSALQVYSAGSISHTKWLFVYSYLKNEILDQFIRNWLFKKSVFLGFWNHQADCSVFFSRRVIDYYEACLFYKCVSHSPEWTYPSYSFNAW